jgi:hypothetical protein
MLVLSFYLVDMLLKQILEQEVDLSGHWEGGGGWTRVFRLPETYSHQICVACSIKKELQNIVHIIQTADIPTRAHIQKVRFFLANLKLARLTDIMLGVR